MFRKGVKRDKSSEFFLLVQVDFVRRRQLLKKLELQVTGRNVRAKDGELAASQAKVDALTEEAGRLKKQLDSAQASNTIKLYFTRHEVVFFARSPSLYVC